MQKQTADGWMVNSSEQTRTRAHAKTQDKTVFTAVRPLGLREACGRASRLCIIAAWLPQLQDQRLVKQLQAVLPVQQLPRLR